MTIGVRCERAETLAGAIALGEANEVERNAYRAHLAACPSCLEAFGGEREIERVMAIAARAREDERWEPALRTVRDRRFQPAALVRWSTALATAALFTLALLTPQRGTVIAHRPSNGSSAIAALNTQIAPRNEQQAESLAFGSASAHNEAAVFALSIDRHGRPKACRIVRTSGFSRLDDAVCRAAMQTHAPAK
jgi:Putative zinc-finger/TonB C terminal